MRAKILLSVVSAILFAFFLTALASLAMGDNKSKNTVDKAPAYYQGPWVTTNRKLDGTLSCEVQQLSPDTWQGRFWGTWQQMPLDYTVQFGRKSTTTVNDRGRLASIAERQSEGVPVTGKSTIDGAYYDWIGVLSAEEFDIQFTGSRYQGHLELKRSAEPIPKPAPTPR